jgi:16S rRNA C967 or C1407 C5-methylase (RsmB/RsmF family)
MALLGPCARAVPWLPAAYEVLQVDAHVPLASLREHQLGVLCGMDASSAVAVAALDVSAGMHVLDLCAAPGAKLGLLADVMQRRGTLTGVDVSRVS